MMQGRESSEATETVDLSQLHDALASKSLDKIADIADELMLEVASRGVAFHEDWPYAIHLFAYFYINDLNSARFLWKSIPAGVKEARPEAAAAWKVGQCLWERDYAGVYASVCGFEWSLQVAELATAFSEIYTKRMFQLLMSAYSTISVSDTSHFLGMTEDETTKYALQQGSTMDPSSQMLTVNKLKIVSEQKVDPSKLQRLTEYVFHLEH